MNKKITNKFEYYKRLHKLNYSPLKPMFYDFFVRPFDREKALDISWRKPAKDLALREFGLRFTNDSVVTELFVERDYLKYREFIPRRNEILVDAGAQYGDYAILCGRYYGARVHAFEPLADNVRIIKNNIALNKVDKSNLILYPVALGDSNKILEIAYDSNMMNSRGKGKKQRTKVRTLDSYGLKPSILKIDVEGFEMEVLKGASRTIRRYNPKVIIEVHSSELKKEVTGFLQELGYFVVHEGRSMKTLKSGMDNVQNLFFLKK